MRVWIPAGTMAMQLLMSGCGPLLLQQGPRTVEPGKVVVGAATGVYHDQSSGSLYNTANVVGIPEGWVRTGLSSGVDAGLTVSSYGLRADGKAMLLRGDGLEVAVDAGIDGSYIDSHTAASGGNAASTTVSRSTGADGAVILGTRLSNGGEFFVAGRIGYQNNSGGGGDLTIGGWDRLWGGTIGIRLPIKEQVFIIPEIDVVHTEAHPSPVAVDTAIIPGVGFAAGF